MFRIFFVFFILCGCFSKQNEPFESENKTSVQPNLKNIQQQLSVRLQELKKSLDQKIDNIFKNASTSDLLEQTNQFILEIEPEVRKIVRDSSLAPTLKEDEVELTVQNRSVAIETYFIEKILNRMQKKAALAVEDSLHTVNQSVEDLSDGMDHFSEDIKQVHTSDIILPQNEEEDTLTAAVYDQLKSQYSRKDLGVLNDESLLLDSDYVFQSSNSDFLGKIKKIYSQLHISNPYNEQGILARECGLQYIKQADQVYVAGNTELAEGTLRKAQEMISITEGNLPEGEAMGIYENCTKKNLLTGERT